MGQSAVAELQRETTSSIELQRAKDGTYYWTVKRYYESSQADEALKEIKDIDTKLRAEYLPKGE